MAYFIATVKVQDENERGRITYANEIYCRNSRRNTSIKT